MPRPRPPANGQVELIVHTAGRLREQGVTTAILYLSGINHGFTFEQWCLRLIIRLSFQLELEVVPSEWWAEHAALGVAERLRRFLRDAVLEEITGPLVIFIDELEVARKLKFSDDFFAAVRSFHEARSTDPAFNG